MYCIMENITNRKPWLIQDIENTIPEDRVKCAKLAKLVEPAVWEGGAANMSPPRSERRSNFFSD